MTESGGPMKSQHGANAFLIPIFAAVVYFGLPEYRAVRFAEIPQWFPKLADAILHGRLWIAPEGAVDELIPASEDGRYFVAYPPLPAIVMLPLVALVGDFVTSTGMCRLLMASAVILFHVALGRAALRLFGERLRSRDHALLVAFFAFGTAVWDSAARAGDWHFAHACALNAMLLAVIEFYGRRRALLIGAAVGLAMLSRPTCLFAGLFFVFDAVARRAAWDGVRLCAGPMIAVALLAVYNAARFGEPFDFHYSEMILRNEPQRLLSEYGQFNVAFVPKNLFWFFAAPPAIRSGGGFPWIVYDPRGLSLFLASPALAYAIVGALRGKAKTDARLALAASLVCLIPLLMYFNTGFWQFGNRFSLDYLPVFAIAVIIGLGPRPTRLARVLLTASIAVHIWGIVLCGIDRVAMLPAWMLPGP